MKTIISEADLVQLMDVLQSTSEHEAGGLKQLLCEATPAKEAEVPPKTVRLNSLVVLWHSFLKKMVRLRIVLPDKADLSHRNISVLAPLSLAILGHRENDCVTVNIGGISKQLKIIKVSNITAKSHLPLKSIQS